MPRTAPSRDSPPFDHLVANDLRKRVLYRDMEVASSRSSDERPVVTGRQSQEPEILATPIEKTQEAEVPSVTDALGLQIYRRDQENDEIVSDRGDAPYHQGHDVDVIPIHLPDSSAHIGEQITPSSRCPGRSRPDTPQSRHRMRVQHLSLAVEPQRTVFTEFREIGSSAGWPERTVVRCSGRVRAEQEMASCNAASAHHPYILNVRTQLSDVAAQLE